MFLGYHVPIINSSNLILSITLATPKSYMSKLDDNINLVS